MNDCNIAVMKHLSGTASQHTTVTTTTINFFEIVDLYPQKDDFSIHSIDECVSLSFGRILGQMRGIEPNWSTNTTCLRLDSSNLRTKAAHVVLEGRTLALMSARYARGIMLLQSARLPDWKRGIFLRRPALPCRSYSVQQMVIPKFADAYRSSTAHWESLRRSLEGDSTYYLRLTNPARVTNRIRT